jgi:hypothetical protein
LNRLPQVNDLVTLKDDIGLGDLRGKKLKVVWVDKKKNPENHEWYEIGCVLPSGGRYVCTEEDIESVTEGKEKVSFT